MNKYYPVYFALLLLAITACKDRCFDPSDIECENYDPCYGFPERPAAFEMSVELYYGRTAVLSHAKYYHSAVMDKDTLFYINTVKLKAEYEHATSYYWQIGDEAERREGKEIQVVFDYPWEWVDITLFVEYDDKEGCYQSYTESDSLTKSIYLARGEELPFHGLYEVYEVSDPEEKFTVEIDYELYYPAGQGSGTTFAYKKLAGFPPYCTYAYGIRYGARDIGFFGTHYESDDRCSKIEQGVLHFSEDYKTFSAFSIAEYADYEAREAYIVEKKYEGYKLP